MPHFERDKFIHIHIPKTGGTSLRSVFMEAFGAENTLQWVDAAGGFVPTSELRVDPLRADRLRKIAKHIGVYGIIKRAVKTTGNLKSIDAVKLTGLEEANFTVVMGHLSGPQLDHVKNEIPRTTIIREPLDRTWSHYKYWQAASHEIPWQPSEIQDKKRTSFEEFALHPVISNFQASWLGSQPISVLGTLDDLGAFLTHVGISTSIKVPALNMGPTGNVPKLGADFLQDFFELHNQDYELYELAKEQK